MKPYARCYAMIDLDAIRHNIREVRKRLEKGTKLLVVIKANAYGHGANQISEILKEEADYFGVATLEEAVKLRNHGVRLPILILGYTSPSQYDLLIQYDITPVIYQLEMAEQMNEAGKKAGKKATIHIAVDTGMSRIGFQYSGESLEEIKKISQMEYIHLEGMFSHFSCADQEDKTYCQRQLEVFEQFHQGLEKMGVKIPINHICNSAGIMEFDAHRYQMVRSGIITYGMYPSEEVNKNALDLHPALEWKTHVVNIKTVEPGWGVSYGATYVTKEPTRIATLSVGYADGYPRSLSSRGRVLIHGKSAPILGRVCMDQMMVDVSQIPEVQMEDEVTLIGKDGEEEITVEEAATLAGSFNYEFVCDITERVIRYYR